MKKIIMSIMFAFVAGICFGQITVLVMPFEEGYKPKFEPDMATRLVEGRVVQLGYNIVDHDVLEDVLKRNGYHELDRYAYDRKSDIRLRVARELNADFIITGVVHKSKYYPSMTDVKTDRYIDRGNNLSLQSMRLGESNKNIDTFITTCIGKSGKLQQDVEEQQEYQQKLQQELTQRETSPENEAWRNKNVYMSTGIGSGFVSGFANVGGTEYSAGGVAPLTGSIQFDFGESTPKMSKKGTYFVGYSTWLGTGLTFSFSGGNAAFWLPVEWRGATRFEKTEIAGGIGVGIGFGTGFFSYGFSTRGSVGFKAGSGIIFLEAQLNGGMTGDSSGTFSVLGLLGYKFGF